MLNGGLDCLSGRLAIALLSVYFWQHNFPLLIPASKPSFSPFSIFCCLVMARQTDGAFSDSGFDPSEYSVSSYPVVFHIIRHTGHATVTLCFWSPRAACQSISGLAVKGLWCHLSYSVGFFTETTRKGTVVSRTNSIGSTSASSVPNTGIMFVTEGVWHRRQF